MGLFKMMTAAACHIISIEICSRVNKSAECGHKDDEEG